MLSSIDELSIYETMDNYYDGLLVPQKDVQRFGYFWPNIQTSPFPAIVSEHGFSCYIVVKTGNVKRAIVFDFGLSCNGVTGNMAMMGLDPSKVVAAVLSHGHFDHYGGVENVIETIPEKIPLYVGPDVFCKRYIHFPTKQIDLGALDEALIKRLNCDLCVVNEPKEIIPGAMLIGPVSRVTEFEQSSPGIMIEREGVLEQDGFNDELSMVFNVNGKGLVVLTACAHAGIINIIRQAVEVTGIRKVHAVLGGFHLIGAEPQKIMHTIAEMKKFEPDIVVPMHCSGFEAVKAFSSEMKKEFRIYSTGSRFIF